MSARVAILVGIFNGDGFLREQLATVAGQTVPGIDVWASDDGSTDGSRAILEETAAGWTKGAFTILDGPRQGFAENFRSMLVNPDIRADYYAFCDQDDIWDADKLEAAVAWLSRQPDGTPALICGRTRIVDIDGRPAGQSPLFLRPPSFRNAIVQSIAGGNTMVMNLAAWDLMAEASRRSGFVSHDWWCYMVVTGAGGVVHYDPEPRIGYRQHVGNLVGANDSLRARLGRTGFLLRGGFARWTDRNIAGLRACEDLLTRDARDVLDRFEAARTKWLPHRLVELHRTGAHRQTARGQASLFIASAINRL